MENIGITGKESLFKILDLLDSLNMRYWVDGGWGVDILLGKQSRDHRDVDINFDGEFTESLLTKLEETGYIITTDWRPCRIELRHPDLGYLDIHPLVIAADGSARQADLSGGFYELESAWFSGAEFEGRVIPCTSAAGVKDQESFENPHAYFLAVIQGFFHPYYYTRGTAISFLMEEEPEMKCYLAP